MEEGNFPLDVNRENVSKREVYLCFLFGPLIEVLLYMLKICSFAYLQDQFPHLSFYLLIHLSIFLFNYLSIHPSILIRILVTPPPPPLLPPNTHPFTLSPMSLDHKIAIVAFVGKVQFNLSGIFSAGFWFKRDNFFCLSNAISIKLTMIKRDSALRGTV
jgi:hypothetical protein